MIVAANFSHGQRLSFCNNKFGVVSMSLTFMLYPIYRSKKGLAQAKKNKHNTAFPPSPAFLYCAPIPFITPLSPVLFFLHLLLGFHFSFSLLFFVSVASSEYNSFFRVERRSKASLRSVHHADPQAPWLLQGPLVSPENITLLYNGLFVW